MDGIPRKQYGYKSNAHQGGAACSSSPGKRKGKAAGGGGGKKPPIKVVYIGNPMRVTTSEAGFRALVQELTGRHADPYKYSGSGSAAVDAADDSSGGSPVGPHQAGALPISPVSTPSSDAASAAGAAHASVPAAYDDDDEDSFAPQLIDNSYSVFSPPTFLYGPHGDGEL
ncbi:uncharacterized protein C2845_PM06G17830 [Panicum miliaceum]|uniref:VQ domain-containing protein n=1 Tax=Panicum miliaceum TaxID=4540 RepID=A0A3L6REK3_PANMI|nr:uncharacterized protein C2845_PM06G17830 [Panicum miliaceum]